MKAKNIVLYLLILWMSPFLSCKKFLEVDPPKNSLIPQTVFKSDELATAAMLGIYQKMAFSDYASGDVSSISVLCGLTADEYTGYGSMLPFSENQIMSENSTNNFSLWTSMYASIYNANTILEGIEGKNELSPPVKTQLKGEALFIRAFCYFYLVNLYGAVPLQLTTDYRLNSIATRSPVDLVYQQIVKDLKSAESLLAESYISDERVRPNKAAAQALLARTYLYLKDWISAEHYSSMVIGQTDTYELVSLANVFLMNSHEAIWQLMPPANSNTPAASYLILNAAPTFVSLRAEFVQDFFETNDQRRRTWVNTFTDITGNYYYPFKYKIKSAETVSEYTMVLRLAEQFLIRAESRLYQGNLAGAIADLDLIRVRAGLPALNLTQPALNPEQLLNHIRQERFCELFSEWGDRWFDLKRTGQVNTILSRVKTEWKESSSLFPIPLSEINNNSQIIQNEGY